MNENEKLTQYAQAHWVLLRSIGEIGAIDPNHFTM
jgi:hypothetical protein